MSTLFEKHNTGQTNDSALSGDTWHAQTFTPTIAHQITSVKLYLYKVEGPGTLGTVTVSIRATDGDGKPTGSDLCSESFDGTTLSTTPGGWKEITLGAGYNLASGTKYAIVLRAVAIGSGVQLDWWYGGTYTGGQGFNSSDADATWADYSVDFMFEEWGNLTIPDTGSGGSFGGGSGGGGAGGGGLAGGGFGNYGDAYGGLGGGQGGGGYGGGDYGGGGGYFGEGAIGIVAGPSRGGVRRKKKRK